MLSFRVVSSAEKFNGISVPNWQLLGPGGALNVQSSTMAVSSAANDIAKVGNALLLATVNGGVWRTTDPVTNPRPRWVNVFDAQPVTCQSMTRLYVSPSANTSRVYALCGMSTSSQMGFRWNVRNSGDLQGFAVSNDGGITWKMANFFPNYSLEGIVELPNGDVIVSSRGSFYGQDTSASSSGGIWVSSNIFDQSSWKQTSTWPTFALQYDPILKTVFASTASIATGNGTKAVLSSTDGGRTWSDFGNGIYFGNNNFVPFYSCLALIPGKALFLGVLLTPSLDLNGLDWVQYGLGAGWGRVYYFNLTSPDAKWRNVGAQPAVRNPANLDSNCYYTCIINGTAPPGVILFVACPMITTSQTKIVVPFSSYRVMIASSTSLETLVPSSTESTIGPHSILKSAASITRVVDASIRASTSTSGILCGIKVRPLSTILVITKLLMATPEI